MFIIIAFNWLLEMGGSLMDSFATRGRKILSFTTNNNAIVILIIEKSSLFSLCII